MRRVRLHYGAMCLLTAWTLSGCDMNTKPKVIEPPPPDPAPTESRQDSLRLLARVNDQPVLMETLYDVLVRDYGLQVGKQLVHDELVRQELQRRNLPTNVTDQEVDVETRRALEKVYLFDKKFTPQQLDDLLNQLLSEKKISRRMWNSSMRRLALLSRLAENDPRVKVTDEDIRRAFFEEYDGKFKVRHVQVPSMVIAQEVLDKAGKGADFAQLAFQYSTNPSAKTGGWLPDIGPRNAPDTVPPVIVEVVRSMKTPGQVSNIVQVGSNFHVLKLEKIISPTEAKFSDVKGKLRFIVREKKIDQLQPIIMQELIDKAQIEYVDPMIRSRIKRGENL